MTEQATPLQSKRPVGRLAPSPTGAQHVGNARTYLLAWLSIRAQHGALLLRIEDLDSPRVKPGAAAEALEDLHWLGLDWDEGPDIGGPHAPYVQTNNLANYDEALRSLRQQEQVYRCTCTRSEIESAVSAPHQGQEGPVYPGTCRDRRDTDPLPDGTPFAYRFRTERNATPDKYQDHLAGQIRCQLAEELGDFVIAKSDGTPSYQLAVVQDDHRMGVTEVVRGADLIPSTFRQRALYRTWGWKAPTFAHVPLVVGPDGRRLAKRHGDTRLSQLRQRNRTSHQLVGYLAWSAGLIESPEPCQPRDLIDLFSWAKIPRTPLVFHDQTWAALLSAQPFILN